jgi:hypothetical protein
MRQAWRRKITVADLPPPSSNALAMPGLNGDLLTDKNSGLNAAVRSRLMPQTTENFLEEIFPRPSPISGSSLRAPAVCLCSNYALLLRKNSGKFFLDSRVCTIQPDRYYLT